MVVVVHTFDITSVYIQSAVATYTDYLLYQLNDYSGRTITDLIFLFPSWHPRSLLHSSYIFYSYILIGTDLLND